MAVPTKEELKAQRELKEYLKTLKKDSEVFTGLAGGFAAVGRGVSTAGKIAKVVKNSKRGKDAFNQLASKLKSFQSTAKKGGKKAKSTVKEVVETKPIIPTTVPAASDKIKSLSNAEIKAFKNVKNIRELAEKQAKNVSTTTSNAPVAKELWKKPLPTPSYTNDGFRIGGTEAKSILSKLKDSEAAKNAAKKAFEKGNAEIIKKGVEKSNAQTAMSIAALTSVIGGGAGATYYGMQLSNKDKKQTTTPQKTGPIDLKRINKNNLKDSSIPGVKKITAIVNGEEKEFGIVWDNKTQSWDYYRGDKTKKTPETPKPEVVKKEDVGGGGVTPIKDNKGGGSGGGTTTKSKTRIEFEKAFAEARKQAGGAGGIFEFNNKKYGTALEGETVPKNRVEVGKTTAPVTIKNEYPTAESDPTLEIAMQQDSIRQQMATKPLPTKPLSELVFKTTAKAAESQKIRNSMDEQNALRSIIADNRIPLKKKRYGGNLAMLKYMK